MSSFKMVPLAEQIEKYCCGLPKGIEKHCTKTSVMNMAQLMKNAEVADDLIQGKLDEDGCKIRRKNPKENNFQPREMSLQGLRYHHSRKSLLLEVSLSQGTGLLIQGTGLMLEICNSDHHLFQDRGKDSRGISLARLLKSKALRDAKKCVVKDILQMNAHKGIHRITMTSLAAKGRSQSQVQDLYQIRWVTSKMSMPPNVQGMGKSSDQEVLVFFDPGARANFISPELASKLGICTEEMGMTREAGLACLGHSEAVTPILGKLRLHIQSYVDAEEFHIMPLQDCDVLLGIPWCYRLEELRGVWNTQWDWFHRPIHAVAHLLHPLWRSEEQYENEELEQSLQEYFLTWAAGDVQMLRRLEDDLLLFRNRSHSFGRPTAELRETRLQPVSVSWWEKYGSCAPTLKRLAVRILSQDCSSCLCERNWSTWALFHTKKRNRLSTAQLERLVYCHCNLRLLDHTATSPEPRQEMSAPAHQTRASSRRSRSARGGASTSAFVLSPSSSGSADEGGGSETDAASASASSTGTSSDADAEDADTEEHEYDPDFSLQVKLQDEDQDSRVKCMANCNCQYA
ncbi:hypothetical protein L7F22_064592 [Adiantum nelumboides]|nr:hypothetical protein [Adiantum nelumboides]